MSGARVPDVPAGLWALRPVSPSINCDRIIAKPMTTEKNLDGGFGGAPRHGWDFAENRGIGR